MMDTPITSLPGYPYFYAIPISGYIRDGSDRLSRTHGSRSRLQDRFMLPIQHPDEDTISEPTPLYELGGVEIFRHELPDTPPDSPPPPPYAVQSPPSRPRSEMLERRRSHLSLMSTRHASYKSHKRSSMSSASSTDSMQDLWTIDEHEPEPENGASPRSRHVGNLLQEAGNGEVGEEEQIQMILIESIYHMLHKIEPDVPTRKVVKVKSRRTLLGRQASIRV